MAVEKLSKTGCLFVRVAVHVVATAVLLAVIAVFVPHERIRMVFKLLADLRMVLQVGVERRMIFCKFSVVYERRIFAKLLGDFAVTIKELIEARQFPTSNVVAPAFVTVEAILVPHERVRMFL